MNLILRVSAFFLLSTSSCFSQEVVASDGDYFTGAQGSLSWTIGEAITETFSNGSGILTQGFQQKQDYLGLNTPPTSAQIHVFPNPFIDELQLEIEGATQFIQVRLFDLRGRLVFENSYSPANGASILQLQLSSLLSGSYHLHVVVDNEAHPFIHSLVKIH